MSTPNGSLQYPSIPNNGFNAIAWENKFTCEMTDNSYKLSDYTKCKFTSQARALKRKLI